tara:strand:+ start:5140 stop:6021 length:882 start_codon:yes stop_codon:yes gene_type:complete
VETREITKEEKLLSLIKEKKISFSDIHKDLDNNTANKIWQKLYTIRMDSIEKYMKLLPYSYIKDISILNYNYNKIPTLSALNKFLNDYGWACCWSYKLSEEDFFYLAANKIFAITSHCRDINQLDRSIYPDFIHDLWGHIPLLSNKLISDLILILANQFLLHEYNNIDKKINKIISINAKNENDKNIIHEILADQKISKKKAISRLFLFTVEFGLLGNITDYKIIGGGIISSNKELANLVSNQVNIKKLCRQDLYINEYCLHDKQRQYFILNGIDPVNNVRKIIEAINNFVSL